MHDNYMTRIRAIVDEELTASGHDCDPVLVNYYTMLVLAVPGEITLEHVHDAWAMWRIDTRPDHQDLVPFRNLSDETAAYDIPFRDALMKAKARIGSV